MRHARWHWNGRDLTEVSPGIWRIEPQGKMRVGVHLVGSRRLLTRLEGDKSVEQAMNVATLPGVLDPVLTMPDIHQGYGFPIGGVAAFHPTNGVVSPGGVGYDINCGVRLLKTGLTREAVQGTLILPRLVQRLFDQIPCGVGSKRPGLAVTERDLDEILERGASWAVRKGFGTSADLEHIEDRGCLPGADPSAPSPRARERGLNQVGTLGSGNHFLELQYVDKIYDDKTAAVFGLALNQIVVAIHTGSRGLGYQVCSDSLEAALTACKKHGIELVDRELAAAPLDSAEGTTYLKAMAAAANFAFANRQIITHWVRECLAEEFGPGTTAELLYDVCHNIAKFETFPGAVKAGGSRPSPERRVCVHRKGATRAYPAKHPAVPPPYREVGQPIFVPGDMGRMSFLLSAEPAALDRSFGSACHGAGRELSRTQAKKRGKGRALIKELEAQGIYVRAAGRDTVLEEMPEAYKDVSEVVDATGHAGIARKVCRLRPLGVVKG